MLDVGYSIFPPATQIQDAGCMLWSVASEWRNPVDSAFLTAFGRRDAPPLAGGRWPTTTRPSFSAVGHIPLPTAGSGFASNDIRRLFDPRRAEPAGSLSVSLSVSLSNGRIGTAHIDSDSDSDSDSDQTPLPIVINRFVAVRRIDRQSIVKISHPREVTR